MVKKYLLLMFAFFLSCNSGNVISQAQEQSNLDEIFLEIQNLANSVQCTDSVDWTFTAIGSKACGGPTGYIAYSLNIDTEKFLSLVEKYTKAQDDFNKKWDIFSDCSIPSEPNGIRCVDGKPEFIY